ncbi:MAG: hypothetical protein K6T73_08740 [Candidatus Bathyarchaeota archaeon]|nr:hypothetical protein [Candidatus Bathyarchaeota archaeon]
MTDNEAENFRGLLFWPTYEHEVVILFSLLVPYLEDSFAIDQYTDSFPDCFAKRNGQKIGIEFEVLVSDFYDHRHNQDNDNLRKCDLLVCWKSNVPWKTIRDDHKEFLKFDEHCVEIMALDKIVERLQKEKSLQLILKSERPNKGQVNKKRFFHQLRENVNEKKYAWIKELFTYVSKQREFEIRWGQGKRWFTMRFYIKKWCVDPVGVQGDGSIWISYAGNPAIYPWELPQKVQVVMRQMFKHSKQKWPTVPLNTQTDFDNIKKALEILAEYSTHSEIIWHRQ